MSPRIVRIVALVAIGLRPQAVTAQHPNLAVGAQYGTTHVYVPPDSVDRFVESFLATFGGTSSKQVITTVTPTPSSTSSQALRTPVGNISLFGYRTPIPYPFGAERTGSLVTNIDTAVASAGALGADVVVEPFDDPIGRDAVIQWPGGIAMQLYWHTAKSTSPPLEHIPENRVYISASSADAFVRKFNEFSHGRVVSDERSASGTHVGRADTYIRRINLESNFGRTTVFVTDGHVPWPYGRETTGYEVSNLSSTIAKARAVGVRVLVEPHAVADRLSAMVEFPGGYIAEIHGPPHH